MLRRLSVLASVWVVLFALLSSVALAQEDSSDDEEATAEPVYYGDTELIETLRTYGLLDEWLAASPVSRPAALLLVTGNGDYLGRRQTFLNALEAWANRTELVRNDLARIEFAQANTDLLRSLVIQVRDALVFDDRLAADSQTLLEIEDALGQLAVMEIPQHELEHSQDSLTLAEVQLNNLRDLAQAELLALNGRAPAFANTGIEAFVGFERLQTGLANVEQLIERGRDLIRPAREESERLVSSALAQIPSLHAARMLGSSDVGGLSVVTIDAYIRAAALSSCSVDWALLAGIGKIESNHGRIGGASVSSSGKVSTTILGPLLDGGETARDTEEARQLEEERRAAVERSVEAARLAAQAAFESWGLSGSIANIADIDGGDDSGEVDVAAEAGDQGNGFAVVVDSDGGSLDGNDQWDRAIGPMQFLPETWSKWATDGNGDGISDPHNLYDAAASAGRFLCHLSATRGSSPSTFVLGYNASTSYVRSVLATAQSLRATSLPDA